MWTSAAFSAMRDKRTEPKSMLESFDPKANQLFNILSTVLKAVKEMSKALQRNML